MGKFKLTHKIVQNGIPLVSVINQSGATTYTADSVMEIPVQYGDRIEYRDVSGKLQYFEEVPIPKSSIVVNLSPGTTVETAVEKIHEVMNESIPCVACDEISISDSSSTEGTTSFTPRPPLLKKKATR